MNDNGTVVWSELMTTEVEKAKSFYGRTLGLGFDAFGDGAQNYWLATRDGKPVWGIMDMTGKPVWGIMDMTGKPGGPSGWFTYMMVDDLDAHVRAAQEAVAELCMPVFEVPSVGRIAILQDPTGAIIGWMKPVPRR